MQAVVLAVVMGVAGSVGAQIFSATGDYGDLRFPWMARTWMKSQSVLWRLLGSPEQARAAQPAVEYR